MIRSAPIDFTERVIHGDRFSAIADVEINRNAGRPLFRRGMELLGRGARIVFVKTDYLTETFRELEAIRDPEPFILVSHNSDYPITRAMFEGRPACVARWYALNVAHEAPDLIPIPSGMERPGGGGRSANYSNVTEAWRRAGVARPFLAFGCWNPVNNARERIMARGAFNGRPGFEWRGYGVEHLEFLELCGRSRFVVSPPGNGVDCHRTWEAMYMGAVPIVKRSPHTTGLASLPMLLVDDWLEATDDVLAATLDRLAARPEAGDEPLYFDFWERRIRDDARRL